MSMCMSVLEQSFHLVVHILGSIAEFFVEYLVRSGEAEALQAPYRPFTAGNESFKGDRQSGSETELLDSGRKNSVLIFLGLCAEESF